VGRQLDEVALIGEEALKETSEARIVLDDEQVHSTCIRPDSESSLGIWSVRAPRWLSGTNDAFRLIMPDVLVLLGFGGGFVALLSGVLWLIAAATNPDGEGLD